MSRFKGIQRLFEDQVKKTPDHTAVYFEDTRLTYCQLNRRANELAYYLLDKGASHDTVVAISVKRSMEMIIGLLGILKAGAAYVPLDPDYPSRRLDFMLQDTDAPIILTQLSLKNRFNPVKKTVLCLDTDWETLVDSTKQSNVNADTNPEPQTKPEHLIYVMYTSGTTGFPKGVMNTHQGLENRLTWMQRVYPLKNEDKVVQKTPFGFDVSVWELFWPLIAGAQLVMAPPDIHKDPDRLAQLIWRHQISVVHFVPSMLADFVALNHTGACDSLRLVFASGEVLPGALVEQFFKKLKAQLHNLYGPTEAAIDVSYYPCKQGKQFSSIPLGRPIDNIRLYILDADGCPVLTGETGELCIAGIGVARGYLNQPQLTQEKFIKNPYAKGDYSRLYRTGDRARTLPDGNIEFIGRIDDQVKIKGVRIELGEIEGVIRKHQTIKNVGVIAHETEEGEKYLAAYVVPKKQDRAPHTLVNELQTLLKKELPDYMMPARFIVLAQLPLSLHGKLNKKSLSDLPRVSEAWLMGTQGNRLPVRDPMNKTLHQLFEEQVVKSPDRVALIYQHTELSCQELNHQANQLAHYLIALGVKNETLLAVHMAQGLNRVIVLLAILKAGGAYVPLDPDYPLLRLMDILNDSHASMVFSEEADSPLFKEYRGRVRCFNKIKPLLKGMSTANLCLPIKADGLAYVIYTSGSTGKPKGVLGHHGGMVNRILWGGQYMPYQQDEVCCQKTSLNFIDSLAELFSPLLNGIKLVLVSHQEVKNPQALSELISEYQISRLVLVPSLLHILLESQFVLNLVSLKWVIVSGERLPAGLARRFFEALPTTRLLNIYGCSEVAADATCYDFRGWSPQYGRVPIGQPISNVDCYVLDSHRIPVPKGEVGELFIGGLAVARGYLNQPEITQSQFITNPFLNGKKGKNHAYLYRTGDLACFLPDGNLDYIGRVDEQVKIRGARVELGEIEQALLASEGIKKAAVIAIDDDKIHQKRLVAFVVSTQHESIDRVSRRLKTTIQKKLPDYMVPSLFMVLNDLPLNPNGKIDKQTLAKDIHRYQRPESTVRKSSDAIKQTLLAIWSELLFIHPRQIRMKDNFFLSGGHSLLATLLCSRIKQEMRVELSIHDLFDHLTMEEMIEKIKKSKKSVLSVPEQRSKQWNTFPLSLAQRSMWLIDNHFYPHGATYNLPLAFELKGVVDREALEKAFRALMVRHDILRTQFVNQQGIAHQIVLPADQCDPVRLVVLNRPELAQTAERLEYFRTESLRPFSLSQPPLFRVQLLRLAKQKYLLFMVIHHGVCDGWSLEIMIRELSKLYNDYAWGVPHSLDSLPLQYGDFVLRQQRMQQSKPLDKQLKYWEKQLSDTSTRLRLPGRKPRAEASPSQATTYSMRVDAATHERLNHLAAEHKASLFMVLLSGLYALLYRYTQQESLVVGTPIANRQEIDFEQVMGPFIHTLALSAHIHAEDTFSSLLKQVRQVTLDAYHHQDVSLDRLVEHLRIVRTPHRHPLIPVMLVLQNNKPITLNFTGVEGQWLPVANAVAKFDLTILVHEERDKSLRVELEYPVDLFEQKTMERMAHHFVRLLQCAAERPTQKIHQLPLLSNDEKARLLSLGNCAKTRFHAPQTMGQWFEEQVVKSPENTAVLYQKTSLTYRQLNERANQLADYLIQSGVKPDTRVAIHLKRHPDLMVVLLGILKAGGAYVPLDLTSLKRSLDILHDSQAAMLFTDTPENQLFQDYHGPVICLETLRPQLARRNTANPKPVARSDNLAYLIYTSGSTGRPKGVMVEHRGLVNLAAQASLLGINEKSRVLQFAPIHFDAFVWEWVTTWSQGAALCFAPCPQQLVGEGLARVIDDERITIATLPPSIFATLPYAKHDSLETLVLAGEKHPASLLTPWKDTVTLFNAYGPTEATVCSSIHQYTLNSDENNIGKPLTNCQFYILDDYLQPVPIGVAGELFIGGVGVARGYLKQKKLNEQRFIKNPFVKNSRLYRTGDWVRLLPNGDIEYLERKDRQVKLRGFRIEPGEIESVLRSHDMIHEALIVATDKKELAAYLIPASEQSELTAKSRIYELKTWLEKQLPHYMVPTVFMWMRQFPLNSNGKVDIHQLPPPQNQYEGRETKVSPRDEIEERLLGIWSHLLDMKANHLSIHDNFFTSGGHSLRAVQLYYELNRFFPFGSFTISDIFEYPTIASLAKRLTDHFLNQQQSNVITIQKQGNRPPLFLIHPSGGTALAYLSFSALRDRPVYGISSPYFGQQETFSSITDMAWFYIHQMKQKQPQGPYYLGGWSFGGTVSLQMANQLQAQGDEVLSVLLIDTRNQSPTLLENSGQANVSEKNATTLAELIDIEQHKSQRLLQHYKPSVYRDSVILLKASGEVSAKKRHLKNTESDLLNGWDDLLPELSVYPVPGNHDTVLNSQHIPYLCDLLQEIFFRDALHEGDHRTLANLLDGD